MNGFLEDKTGAKNFVCAPSKSQSPFPLWHLVSLLSVMGTSTHLLSLLEAYRKFMGGGFKKGQALSCLN